MAKCSTLVQARVLGKRWAADDQDDANDQADEQAASGWERAGRGRDRFFGCERAGDRHGRNDHQKRPTNIATAPVML